MGDNGETRGTGGTEPATQIGQYSEDRGVDESAVGEVDQQRRGAPRQSMLNLRFELVHGSQVQLPAHLHCRETQVEAAVLDLGPSEFRGATVVVRPSDAEDAIRF